MFDDLKEEVSIKYELYHSGAYSLLNDKFSSIVVDDTVNLRDSLYINIRDIYVYYTNKGQYVYKHTLSMSIYIEYKNTHVLNNRYSVRTNIREEIKNEILTHVKSWKAIDFKRDQRRTMLQAVESSILSFNAMLKTTYNKYEI